MGEYPLRLSVRLKQFLCAHETIAITKEFEGINNRKGQMLVLYECGKCRHCTLTWEKRIEGEKRI